MEDKPKSKIDKVKTTLSDNITTLFVLVYIVSGVAVFLILFGWINPSAVVERAVGAIALAYSIIGLLAYIQMGVKHQNNGKKKGRK